MALIDKIPALDDTGLAALLNNARRLEHTGTAAQQKAAVAIIPAAVAETDRRAEAKRAQQAELRAQKRSARA